MTPPRDLPYDKLRAMSLRNKNEEKHEDLFALHGFDKNPPDLFFLELDKCQIPIEMTNVLKRHGLKKLGDLTHYTRDDLENFNGAGKRRLQDLENSLVINGGITLDDLADAKVVAHKKITGAAFYEEHKPDITHVRIQQTLATKKYDVSAENTHESITAQDLFSDETRLLFVHNHLDVMPTIKNRATKEGALTRAKKELLEKPMNGKDHPVLDGTDTLSAIASKDADYFIKNGVSKPSANLLMRMVEAVGGITKQEEDTPEKQENRAAFQTLVNNLKINK